MLIPYGLYGTSWISRQADEAPAGIRNTATDHLLSQISQQHLKLRLMDTVSNGK